MIQSDESDEELKAAIQASLAETDEPPRETSTISTGPSEDTELLERTNIGPHQHSAIRNDFEQVQERIIDSLSTKGKLKLQIRQLKRIKQSILQMINESQLY